MTTLLRYNDLKARGIVNNWVTLTRWIDTGDFPAGRYLGPNIRVWTQEEVDAWFASRPTAKKKEVA